MENWEEFDYVKRSTLAWLLGSEKAVGKRVIIASFFFNGLRQFIRIDFSVFFSCWTVDLTANDVIF